VSRPRAGTVRVVVVGDIVTDVVARPTRPIAADSDTDAAIALTGGGAAANTAVWLAAAGVRTDLVAVVGADAAGAERVAELEASGVGCAQVRATTTAPTGTSSAAYALAAWRSASPMK